MSAEPREKRLLALRRSTARLGSKLKGDVANENAIFVKKRRREPAARPSRPGSPSGRRESFEYVPAKTRGKTRRLDGRCPATRISARDCHPHLGPLHGGLSDASTTRVTNPPAISATAHGLVASPGRAPVRSEHLIPTIMFFPVLRPDPRRPSSTSGPARNYARLYSQADVAEVRSRGRLRGRTMSGFIFTVFRQGNGGPSICRTKSGRQLFLDWPFGPARRAKKNGLRCDTQLPANLPGCCPC